MSSFSPPSSSLFGLLWLLLRLSPKEDMSRIFSSDGKKRAESEIW